MLKPWIRLGCPAKREETLSITPGVSILWSRQVRLCSRSLCLEADLRSALEIFHDVEKFVINIGMLVKLHFYLVQVAKCILRLNVSTRRVTHCANDDSLTLRIGCCP